MVQTFLNIVEWGMGPQEAINQPRFKSRNFPDSFSPHLYYPGRLLIEAGLADRADALRRMGYEAKVMPPGTHNMGAVCAIIRGEDGSLIGGADPREQSLALGD